MSSPERIGRYLLYPHTDIDSSRAPIYLTLPTRHMTPESYRKAFDIGRAWWPILDHPVAWITDTRNRAETLDARMRAEYAQYIRDIKGYQDRYLMCSAIIAVDAAQKGISTAIRWQSQQRCPQEFFGDLASALAWCESMLAPHVDMFT